MIKNIHLLILDVDGVLTDGSILLDDNGVETKRFNVRDGAAIRIWQRLGYDLAIVTARAGMAMKRRAAELDISHVIQGAGNKAEAFESVLALTGRTAEETAAIGDDLPDLPLLRRAGYPMAVADAAEEVIAIAAYVTSRPGGRGAVREAIEHILKAHGRWDEALGLFG